MKSMLREFIRETLLKEAVMPSRFGTKARFVGYGDSPESTPVYKRIEKQMTKELGNQEQTWANWLNDFTNRKAPKSNSATYTPKRNAIVRIFQTISNTQYTNPDYIDKKYGKEMDQAGFDAYKKELLQQKSSGSGIKSAVLLGAVIAAVAAGSYYYSQKDENPEDLPKELGDNFIKFNDELVSTINSMSNFDSALPKQGMTTFANDWPKIEAHFQQLSNNIVQAKSYDDYFRIFNDSNFKTQVDLLIRNYAKDKQFVESSYKDYAFLILIFHTVNSYIPALIVESVKGYNNLNDTDQKEVTDFIEKTVTDLKNSQSYRESLTAYKDLETIA